jgi:hypothetical protein
MVESIAADIGACHRGGKNGPFANDLGGGNAANHVESLSILGSAMIANGNLGRYPSSSCIFDAF